MDRKNRRKLPPSMGSELEEASSKFAWLNLAFANDDLQRCVTLLSELKVLLTKFPSLPPSFVKTPNAIVELKLARSIYEHAVILGVKLKDQDALERDFFQLKAFYMDTRDIIPPSREENTMLGLNLMRLFATNRLAEFHTELELLPLNALDHPCIRYTLELEQSFMEGAYNRLVSGRQAAPHETSLCFMDLLVETIRDEIADCCGQAYDYLPVNAAAKLLMFSSDQELLEYISKGQQEWEVKNSSVRFHTAKQKLRVGIQSSQLIKRTLSYAHELEKII